MAVGLRAPATRACGHGCARALYGGSPHSAWIRTLEVSTSPRGPWALLPGQKQAAEKLFRNGIFQATVEPDLPEIAKLMDVFGVNKDSKQSQPDPHSSLGVGLDLSGFRVHTVAAQLNTLSRVEMKIRKYKEETEGALLFVSGGHPLRRIPLVNNFMPTNSCAMLRLAHNLRAQGILPPGLKFWAVENPMINSVTRLEKKIEAGAEAIITQPPLLPETFQLWWDNVLRLGLQHEVPIIVGVPIISSANNFAFWLHLTGASSKASESGAILDKLTKGEAKHDDGTLQFWKDYNSELIKRVEELSGASGMHIMPVTSRGWKELPILAEGFRKNVGELEGSVEP